MKKIVSIILVIFLLFSLNAFAFSFKPNTVKEMEVDVAIVARGAFSGEFSAQDSAEVRMLSFNDSKTQTVLSLDEKLFIGEKIFEPEHEFEGENKIAVFKIENLKEFEKDPSFIIEAQARIKTNARIELDKGVVEVWDQESFLAETKFIEANDLELKSKAELEFSSLNKLELVRDIVTWVNSNIEYDFENYYSDIFSAKETYNSRKGVCDEFANLSAAFFRIKKIPAKYVSGISFDGERFGNHGWLEVFLEDFGWIQVDSTYLEAGFVDGAHFSLASGSDPSDSVNLKIITKSVKPIEVSTILDLPDVKIINVTFFENLTQATLIIPEEVASEESFEISALIKNKLNSHILIPIEIALHEDFVTEKPSRLEIFEPLQEKTVTWSVTAPKKEKDDFYYKYQTYFFAPDQNISRSISFFPSNDSTEQTSNVKIIDVSPFLREGKLFIEVLLENTGKEIGTAELTAVHNFKQTKKIVKIMQGETKKAVLEINDFSFGEVFLSIVSDESKDIKIVIPNAGKIEVINVFEQPKDFFSEIKNFFPLILTGALLLIIAILVLLNLALKRAK